MMAGGAASFEFPDTIEEVVIILAAFSRLKLKLNNFSCVN
jgi:hypothetical protein